MGVCMCMCLCIFILAINCTLVLRAPRGAHMAAAGPWSPCGAHMPMPVRLHLHLCLHDYMSTCLHVYMSQCRHVYMSTRLLACLCCMHMHMHMCIHLYEFGLLCALSSIHSYMCMYAYVHAHLDVRTRAHVRTPTVVNLRLASDEVFVSPRPQAFVAKIRTKACAPAMVWGLSPGAGRELGWT